MLAAAKPFPRTWSIPQRAPSCRSRASPARRSPRDGSVYVAFEDSRSPTSGAIVVACSRDGGRTWTTSALPGVRTFAFEPAVAVDSHGTVE